MRLSDFILSETESILQAWEDFARTIETPMPAMDVKGLRNHAQLILKIVASDMRLPQTGQQQIDKSESREPLRDETNPAHTHAMTRLVAGFTMDQMVSEYRALRSSVLRLWLANGFVGEPYQVQDMIRFNEAIDQALVESIAAYGEAVENTRKTMLAVLGHDLRSPLGAVMMAGGLLQNADYLRAREVKLVNQVSTSVKRATSMVNDLLDLARCNLGSGIPIHTENTKLDHVCLSIIEEVRTAFPDADIEYDQREAVTGRFDVSRMAQVFANLIGNAVRHGDLKRPIHVSLHMDGDNAVFSVRNFGETIPADAIPHLFTLGGRHSTYAAGEKGASAGLGLGLFIASEIVAGHGGCIEASSTDDMGTTFSVFLPIQ